MNTCTRPALCLLVIAAFHYSTSAQAPASGLLEAWSLTGRWTGVVGDEASGAIYALRYDGGAEIDIAGQIRREFPLPPGGGRTLRLGRFPQPTLVTFSVWGPNEVTAYDLSGNRLWRYPRETGVDAVSTGDVDGDGSDELIVGYNGAAGVHVVSGDGQLRWKSTGIGNVWQVAAADVLGQGRAQVVTTSAAGKVHIFSGDAHERTDVSAPGVYATMVRVGKLRQDFAATILAAGNTLESKRNTLTALSADGVIRWRLELPGDVHTAQLAPAGPWLALGTRDGQVVVVDAVKGAIAGVVPGQGIAEVGWVGDPGLLLVATGTSLNAFHISPK